MSFDLIIATRTPPTRTMVESHLREVGWRLDLEGDLAGDRGNLSAGSRGLFRRKHAFVLSGPDPAEHEDFPAPVQHVLRGRGYLLEMNLPWGSDVHQIRRAVALCQHLATVCDGAVFDPQADKILFPVVPGPPVRRQPAMTPVRELTMEWYLATSQRADAVRFLETTRRMWPESAPTRFGLYEPMRFKLADPGGESRFAEHWDPSHAPVFWSAKKPVFGGSIFWSPVFEPPAGAHPRVLLSLSLNASAIESSTELCDRAVGLFSAVAEELGAFFGAAYVTRGVLVGSRGTPALGQGTEPFSDDWIIGPWWLGLPNKPTWLTWFGPPYRALVAANLGDLADPRPGGLLVRLGPAPLDTDQLLGRAPDLPPELLVEIRSTPGEGPRRNLVDRERIPAPHTPALR